MISLLVGGVLVGGLCAAIFFYTSRNKKLNEERIKHYEALSEFSRSTETCEGFDDILRMTAELGNRLFGLVPTFYVQRSEGSFAGFEYSSSKRFDLEGKFDSFLRWYAQNDRPYWTQSKSQNWLGSMNVSAKELSSNVGADLLLPLSEGGTLLALMGWKGEFKPEHLKEINSLKLRSSAALANIRLKEESENLAYLAQELDLAASVELAMIPQSLTGNNGGLHWNGFYQPVGKRGSDFWGVYPMSKGVTYLVMGDAVDSGFAGTMVGGLLKSCVRHLLKTRECISIEELMSVLNRCLFKQTSPALASCFVGIVDTNLGRITYSSAGFPSPYVVKGKEQIAKALVCGGTFLGDVERITQTSKQMDFSKDDALLVATNGLSGLENAHGKLFGERRVIETFRKSLNSSEQEFSETFKKTLYRFRGNTKPKDDIAALALYQK